ncbi:MAG: hypothetical protein EA352_09235 [Gemmatimonadales bacterium]|nr:MAG: hypothetical protein EA352_09235 [Gemmatimonadales bacterium]
MLASAHAFSLGAALVLVAGQWAVARWTGIPLPPEAAICLGAGIWLGYTADRLVDVRRTPEARRRTLRHALHARRRTLLTMGWLAGVILLVLGGAVLLPAAALQMGAGVALVAALYVLGWPRRISARADRLKAPVTALVLTLALAWWPLAMGGPSVFRGRGAALALGLAALGILLNLLHLRRHRRNSAAGRTPGRTAGRATGRAPGPPPADRAGMVADGLLLAGFVALGLLAPS